MSQEYLTKQGAAKRLGISVRRLLEIAQQGLIQKTKVKDDISGQMVSVFPLSEVERVRAARQAQNLRSARALAILRRRNQAITGPIAAMTVPQPSAPLLPRWLTLEQAEKYSGLPASWLLEQIRAGKLIAMDIGKRPGGRWRITRQALRALESGTYYRQIPLSPVKSGDQPPRNGRQFDQPGP